MLKKTFGNTDWSQILYGRIELMAILLLEAYYITWAVNLYDHYGNRLVAIEVFHDVANH
jgi:hypothetical protein